jgi:hypothetical protein
MAGPGPQGWPKIRPVSAASASTRASSCSSVQSVEPGRADGARGGLQGRTGAGAAGRQDGEGDGVDGVPEHRREAGRGGVIEDVRALLGHGLAVRALRATGVTDIGIANSHGPTWPASEEPEDLEAAGFYDLLLNRLFADPVWTGQYPDGLGELMPGDVEVGLKVISEPVDWYGINYYAPTRVGAPQGSEIEFGGLTMPVELPFSVREIEGYPVTDFGWPVVPEARNCWWTSTSGTAMIWIKDLTRTTN